MGLKNCRQKSDVDSNCNWNNYQMICTKTGGNGKKNTRGNHPNYSIVEIGQNAEKKPGDFRRLAVTQTPVKKHRLILV